MQPETKQRKKTEINKAKKDKTHDREEAHMTGGNEGEKSNLGNPTNVNTDVKPAGMDVEQPIRKGAKLNDTQVPCKYHMHGRCTKAEDCRFSHKMAEDLIKVKILEAQTSDAF